MVLLLPTHCYNKIIAEAIEKYPAECCGFLLGKETNEQLRISKIIVCENKALIKEKEFLISANEYKKAETGADEKGLSLIGVYHSHPDWDAIPSATDTKNAMSNFSYLIVSVFKDKISAARSWRLNEQFCFEEETIITNTNSISKNNTAYGNHHYSNTAS